MFMELVCRDQVHLTQHLYLKMRLAIVGSTALRWGSRKPPRCTMSLFLPERGTRLSATARRTCLCFRSLRVTQLDNLTLPFSTFSTHSLILFNSSLSQFETIALRNLGRAVFSTLRA